MKQVLLLSAFLTGFAILTDAGAQTAKSIPGPMISCPPGAHAGHSHVPMPGYIAEKLQAGFEHRDTEEACSQINVNYNGFSPEAEAAFEYAKTIWEHALVSDIPIIINATWTDLGENVLGSAGPSNLWESFPSAPDDRMYPTALANQLAGQDISSGGPHILANFNSEFSWYFGTDGNAPNDLFDFVSVVLHEIGHGLGFTTIRTYDEDTGQGTLGFGSPTIFSKFDDFLLDGPGGTPLMNFGNGTALGNAFKSNNVYSGSPAALSANGGNAPRYYAPTDYSNSSIAHWDESDFPAGNIHSLMTPQIGPGEAIHNPGPITLGLFEDMGWELCESLQDQPCTTWQDPNPTGGYTNFNTSFGGAPCDAGGGCPFNEIQGFEVWAGEAYSVNNFSEGGTYTFSICNGPGAGSWEPDFTVIAPSGAVDAFGTTTPCSISWTASESGTYLIVINEAGNCGTAFSSDNGWPALTCSGSNVACEDSGCETSSLVLDGPAAICQDQSTTVVLPEPPSFPEGGGIRLQFINTATMTGINLNVNGLPYTFDYDLNGLLSANDFDPFEGEYTINIFLYTDADNIAGTICASGEEPATVTFLGADDPLCDDSANNCAAFPLVVDGPTQLCEGETTTLTSSVPPEVPAGGGLLYTFINVDDEDDGISWTGAPFPATIDSDLDGLLSANDFDPFSGTYEVEIYIYTNPADIGGSLCDFGGSPVLITFLDANDPLCDESSDNCSASPLIADGPTEICEGESTTITAAVPPEVPGGGGFLYQFVNVDDEDDVLTWTGGPFPATIDADLNGLLSANDIDPFSGTYEVEIFVFADPDDVGGSLCAFGNSSLTLTFLDAGDPLCDLVSDNCTASPLFVDGPAEICEGESTTITAAVPPEVPAGGGFVYQFLNVDDEDDVLTWNGAPFPATFDNDLNGLLSANDFDPLSGTYQMEIFVFADPDDIAGSICAFGNSSLTLTFLDADDPLCEDPPEACSTSPLLTVGPALACEGELLILATAAPPEVPEGGGIALVFTDITSGQDYVLDDVIMPFLFDADLNGALSGDGLDPLSGDYEVDILIYTDPADVEGSVCAEGVIPVGITFAEPEHPDCEGVEEPCTDWEDPSPTTGYTVFNALFGGAPCDPGDGCPFNEVTTLEVWGGEAYSVDNFAEGGTYTFSICNGTGAGSWIPDFTVIAPSGAVDAFGSDTDCSITWTASESGAYLIVVNESGNCGGLVDVDNGFPALTCEGGPEVICPDACAAGTLVVEGETAVCPGDAAAVFNPAATQIPPDGGYRIRAEAGGDVYFFETSDPGAFISMDNTFDGQAADPYTGTAVLRAQVYEDTADPDGSICDESFDIELNFLAADDEDCTVNTGPDWLSGDWNIYPNPAGRFVTVDLTVNSPLPIVLRITDISGRTVHTEMIGAATGRQEHRVETSKLASGIYMVSLEADNARDVKRLAVQH